MRKVAKVVLVAEEDYPQTHLVAGLLRVAAGVTCLLVALILGVAVGAVADGPEGVCGNCTPGGEYDAGG